MNFIAITVNWSGNFRMGLASQLFHVTFILWGTFLAAHAVPYALPDLPQGIGFPRGL